MNERDCKGQIKRGYRRKTKHILGVDRDQWEFYLMFFSWEIDKKCCQIYTKMIYIKFCIKIVGWNGSYSANIQPIRKQRYPRGA